MWHTDGPDIKSHCRVFRPNSIRPGGLGPHSPIHKGSKQEEWSESITFQGSLDYSPFVPPPKPWPAARRRVFPSIPIPDLSGFHALVVEVAEADGKTYSIAVHPRNHPDPGSNGKDVEHTFTVPPLPDWAAPSGMPVKVRLPFEGFQPYYKNEPSGRDILGLPPWSNIGSVSLVHRGFGGVQAGEFSISINCIQAVQYKASSLDEEPEDRPLSETETLAEPLGNTTKRAESPRRTRTIMKGLSPKSLAARMKKRTARVMGGPDPDGPPTPNPNIMDLAGMNFPGALDWDDSAATAGPSTSHPDQQAKKQSDLASSGTRNRLRKVFSSGSLARKP
ncbi:hypothetical protein QBC39DRAFT_434273 [Podospora conica]|nr:hypothetical protein QBC39DRAFT_434273 [Schizothecium conicum]